MVTLLNSRTKNCQSLKNIGGNNMFTLKNYITVDSLTQAYELNQKKSNTILGGILWLKMGSRNIQNGIDLSKLGLDTIEETNEDFVIGCMCTLRDIELHQGLNEYFDGILKQSVRYIVGTQFRNSATVGGSVFSRFGFSDLLTALLVLDSYVELYKGGLVPIKEFINMPLNQDILVRIHIKKDDRKGAYLSQRNTKTDFPTLTCAVSKSTDGWNIAIGARPKRAMLVPCDAILGDVPTQEEINKLELMIEEQVSFSSNMRGSKEYRIILAKVLAKRAIMQITGGTKA